MILRKPYKFLIKHFKIIHLSLILPILYLIVKTNDIYKFFNNYVSNNYTYTRISNLAGSYINIFMYILALLIIVVSLTIYYLMKQKKKGTKLYLAFIIYYIVLFVALTFFHSVLSDMEINDLSAKSARAYRDISMIINLPQYFFIFYAGFRGLGFDIKSFKFEADLKDLDVSEEDNEEFEFVLGIETYKYKRTARRFIREFKYYVLENKFIFTCLGALTVVIILTTLYMHFNVFNKSYSKNRTFSHSSFTLNVKDSILTNMDYNGKPINKDKYYLVLQVDVTNNSINDVALDTTNFRLQVSGGYLVPTLDRTDYFVDFGSPYHGEKIVKGTSATYNLVYELTKKQVKLTYKIKILENIEYGVGELTAHYKNLNLRPKKIVEKQKVENYNLKDQIDLSESNLGDSTIKIKEYEINDSYYYTYKVCGTNKFCRELSDVVSTNYIADKVSTTLLVLDPDLKIDENSVYGKALKNKKDFYEDYFTVECDGIESTTQNVTPTNLKGKVVLQAKSDIKTANNLNLLITIRDKTYKIKLK